jgi:hypothetical protein
MAITNTRLTDTLPTRVFQSTGQQVVSVMYICNTSDTIGNVSVNVYCINSNDSSAGSIDNTIYSKLEITQNDTYVISTEKLVLDNGDEVEVEANVADVITVTVSSFAIG